MVYTIPKELSIAALPPDVIGELSKFEIRIINTLCRLWGRKARLEPGKPNVPQPGLKWLAEQAGCSYWTASRAISRLEKLFLIKAHQKKTKTGQWLTNNFYLGFIWKLILNGWKEMQKNKEFCRLRGLANIAHKKLNCSWFQTLIHSSNDPPPPNTS